MYHLCLLKSGITGHTFDEYNYDYRLSLFNHLDSIVGATVKMEFCLRMQEGNFFKQCLRDLIQH